MSEDIDDIAAQALDAAEAGIGKAIDDAGLGYTFYLLTQVVLAARSTDWETKLQAVGIDLQDDASIFDLSAEVQYAVDDYLTRHSLPTDISEIAQQAAGEALSTLAGPNSITLFGAGRDELRLAVRDLSTKKGFSKLGQEFFGVFMARYLNSYLSRITAGELGGPRLQQVGDVSQFNEGLRRHCIQSAKIVYDFCGEWYSKTEFREGISIDNTSHFMAVAVRKLQAELRHQKETP